MYSLLCAEWHQYDDVCMREDRGFKAFLRSMVTDRYKNILSGKMMAGEVMLSRIFSILTDCDAINMSNFLIQLRQFYAVYEYPLLIGDRVIQWKSLGFGILQVTDLYTHLSERLLISTQMYVTDVFCKVAQETCAMNMCNEFCNPKQPSKFSENSMDI